MKTPLHRTRLCLLLLLAPLAACSPQETSPSDAHSEDLRVRTQSLLFAAPDIFGFIEDQQPSGATFSVRMNDEYAEHCQNAQVSMIGPARRADGGSMSGISVSLSTLGNVTFGYPDDFYGTVEFDYRLTGCGFTSNTVTSLLRVNPRPDPPTVDLGPDIIRNENQSHNFIATVSDPDLPDDSHTFEWSWDGGGWFVFSDNTDNSLSFSGAQWEGAHSVSVRVTDENNNQATDTAQFIFNNLPPSITTFPANVSGDEGEVLTIPAQYSDPGNDPVTLTWEYGNGSGGGGPRTNGDATGTAFYGDNGTYTATVFVTDDDGARSPIRSVNVTIRNVDPTITDTSYSPTEILINEPVSFSATATDPAEDDDPLTYQWRILRGSSTVATYSSRTPSHTFTQDGPHTARVTVSDDDGGSATQDLVINVGLGAPQIDAITVAPGTPNEGQSVSFAPQAQGNEITYRWIFGDGATSTQRNPSHTYTDNGAYTAQLTVTDAEDQIASRTVNINVRNVAPTFTSGSPFSSGVEGTQLTYTATASDPAGARDPLTFTLDTGPAGAAMNSTTGVLTWTPTYAQAGRSHSFSMTVSDGDGGTDTAEWTVQVAFRDEDADGVPDTCEDQYSGISSDDGCDGVAQACDGDDRSDLDGDGIASDVECANGTDPTTSNAPSAPILISPEDAVLIDSSQASLSCSEASDPDGDSLTYTFEIYGDEALEERLNTASGVVSGGVVVSAIDPAQLTEDARYWWRVRASDGNASGPWSLVRSFQYSNVDNAPSTPVPVRPEGPIGSTVPRFTVENSAEPEGQAVEYVFAVYDQDTGVEDVGAEDAADADIDAFWEATVSEEAGARTSVDWPENRPELPIGTTYVWTVFARDPNGHVSASAPFTSFYVDPNQINRPPTALNLQQPSDNAVIPGAGLIRFVWDHAEDPDGIEGIDYTLMLFNSLDGEPVSWDSLPQPYNGTGWSQDVILPEGNYTWSVEAFDGDFSFESDLRSFTITENVVEPDAGNDSGEDSGNDAGGDTVEDDASDQDVPPDVPGEDILGDDTSADDVAQDVPVDDDAPQGDDTSDPTPDSGGDGSTSGSGETTTPPNPQDVVGVQTEFGCSQNVSSQPSNPLPLGMFFLLGVWGLLRSRRR